MLMGMTVPASVVFLVNGVNYGEKRPRAKGVTRKKPDEGTSVRNKKYLTSNRERTELSRETKRRGEYPRKIRDLGILHIWPKIVEYVGLSEYESKVYLSLVKLGTAGARKLSLNCDVPRTKVYGTLKKLIEYELVLEIPGVPKLFAASNPRDSFNTLLNITKEKSDDFSKIIEELEDIHSVNRETGGPQKKIMWFLGPDEDIRGKCRELIRQSEEEMSVITTEDGLEIIFNCAHRLLDEVQANGVEIKLYSPLDPLSNPLARELSYIFQVKKVAVKTPILFINSDNKRFLLARIAPRGSERPFEAAIFTEDDDLLNLIHLLLVNSNKALLMQAFPT